MELNPMNELDEDTFKVRMGDSFPSIYLTIISIIQGVALGILAGQMDKFVFHPKLGSAETVNEVFVILNFILSFISILIVAYQYAWFIGLFKWSPTFLDIFFPFSLGLAEIMPMFFLDNPAAWMLCTSVFCFVGVFAWRNTLRHCTPSTFGNEYITMKRTKEILIQNINIGRLIGFSLGISSLLILLLKSSGLEEDTILWGFEIFVFSFFLAGSILILSKGEKFMRDLHEDFGYEYDKKSEYKYPIIDLLFKRSSTILKKSDQQETNENQGKMK